MLEFKKTYFFRLIAVSLHVSRSDNAVNAAAG